MDALTTDEDIRRRVWEGHVPMAFHLADADRSAGAHGRPCYVLAARMSYLPLVTAPVRAFFADIRAAHEDGDDAEMWLEFRGSPLKWNYPVGVLFDLFGSPTELPWEVTVHFSGFPQGKVMRCPDDNTVKDYFMNTIKESDFLKHGSTKRVMTLSKLDQSSLWDAVRTMDFNLFWKANDQVFCDNQAQLVRFVPLRVYLPGRPFIQEPIAPLDPATDAEKTVGGALGEILPALFGPRPADAAASDGSEASGSLSATTSADAQNAGSGRRVASPRRAPTVSNPKVLIQGIEVALDLPLTWLSEQLSHADNFLHIVVVEGDAKK